MSDRIYGIDLGTTYCACWSASVDEPDPEPVALEPTHMDRVDLRTLSSVVFVEVDDGRLVATVGRRAEQKGATPGVDGLAIEHPKRFIGLKGSESRTWTKGSTTLDPVDVSALILRHIRRQIGPEDERVRAVVTHPRDFKGERKALTAEAVELAGIELIETLDEPVAAAYAYFQPGEAADPGCYLVFDLGGGTLDIALLQVESGQAPKVIGGAGIPRLGGKEWDERVVELLLGQIDGHITDPVPASPLLTPKCMYDLKQVARDKKHALADNIRQTRQKQFTCKLRGREDDPVVVPLSVSAEAFANATLPLVQRCGEAIDQALASVRPPLRPENVLQVLPVGGSTRLRAIRQLLEARFPGKVVPASQAPDPDHAIAIGAARYAAYLTARETPTAAGRALLQVMESSAVRTTLAHPVNLLIDGTAQGHPGPWLQQVVPQGTALPLNTPVAVPLVVTTAGRELAIEIYEGPGGLLRQGRKPNLLLMFPPTVRAQAGDRVSVELRLGESGRLQVRAVHADGTVVEGDQHAEDNAVESRQRRRNNLASIELR